MYTEKIIPVDDYVFHIMDAGDVYYISICHASEYYNDSRVGFYLIDACAKNQGYSADMVEALILEPDYQLFAVKAMLDDMIFRKNCNTSMEQKMAENSPVIQPKTESVRISEKPLLTVEEMAKLSGIGEKKLYWIIENYASYENNFVIKNGNKNMFKREKFFEFIDKTDVL